MSDGSITISTKLDNADLERELSKIKKQIEKLERSTSAQEAKKAPLVQQAQELEVRMREARAEVDRYRSAWAAGVSGADKEQSEAILKTQQLEAEHAKVVAQIDKIDTKLQPAYQTLDEMKDSAGGLVKKLAEASDAASPLEPALKKADDLLNRFTNRVKGLARRVFVFTLITAALRSLRGWMGKAIKTNSEATASIARLKGALLTLAQPLVNVIIPAITHFVNALTDIVTAIASVISILFGSTLDQSAESAEALYNEQEAISGVGSAAKKAKKDLAAFDEINKLTGDSASAGGGSSGTIKPDFSFMKNGLLSDLTFTLDDILFKWDDLTAEDVLAKIVTALTAIAGGVIGFTCGGIGGAAIGIAAGAGLGLMISNLLFDGDGVMSPEEILESVIFALGTLAGGILGFAAGGPGGAAIGILVGAGIALAISRLVFNGDGQISDEEITSAIIVVLGAIAGAVIGFYAGGPGGALIGMLIGAGIVLAVKSLSFKKDGGQSVETIVQGVVMVLGALVGGIVGFFAGGPLGALIGMAVGTGISLLVGGMELNGDGAVNKSEVLNMIVDVLFVLVGGGIGFVVGGPVGALVGIAITAGIELLVKNVAFADKTANKRAGYEEGEEVGENVAQGTRDSLGVNSPSTVYNEIGDNMMKGLANGISEDKELVTTAMGTVLDAIETKFSEWQTNFMLGFGGFKEVFAGEWRSFWKNQNVVFVSAWNDILESFQDGINNAVSGLNRLVRSANELSDLTGKSYPRAQSIIVNKLPIPKLATGAVIPPNREFLAVLGDQKSGTNIEAPMEMLVQAFKVAAREMVGNGNGNTTIIMELDGQQFAKLVYKANKSESRRVGVSLAGV